MVNKFIVQPKKEGETRNCENCGKPIIGRLKVYAEFKNKIQWQNLDKTEAHYDKMGDCKGEKVEAPAEKQAEPKKENTELDLSTKKIVANESTLLFKIKKEVEATIKEMEVEPNMGMIWQMTELIWKKYFEINHQRPGVIE